MARSPEDELSAKNPVTKFKRYEIVMPFESISGMNPHVPPFRKWAGGDFGAFTDGSMVERS
jgi:hypothetical protein